MIKRIAVIGSGISGLVSACLLSQRYDVALFEENDYLGGHTHTVDIEMAANKHAIDTGFIVFNKRTYPNFNRLIQRFNIPIQKTEMSFSYHSDINRIEYNGTNLNTLFADRSNILNPYFYRFIKDILRFNRDAKEYLTSGHDDVTIMDFTRSRGYGRLFLDAYMVPIFSAIWTKKVSDVWHCSARFLLDFFNEHGLLNIYQRPQWYTIVGGSRNYIPKLTGNFKDKIYLNTKIEKIERKHDSVILRTREGHQEFNMAVLAVHSDQALQMLADPTEEEERILGAIQYSQNEAILHSDISLLPKKRRAWASWNYVDIGSELPTLTYYMNRLQDLSITDHVCISINLGQRIKPDKIIQKFSYAHPVLNVAALEAQKKRSLINGSRQTYYCGAYWGHGFHEDGVNSALEVARLLEAGPLCNL